MSGIRAQLEQLGSSLGPAGQRVLAYFLDQGDSLLDLPIAKVAKACRTSPASITRLCKKLGFQGVKDFRIALAQDGLLSQGPDVSFAPGDQMAQVYQKIVAGSIQALMASLDSVDEAAMEKASRAIVAAHEVKLYGLGGAIAIGSYFKHQLMKIGIRTELHCDTQSINLSLPQLDGQSLAIAISCSGATPEIVHALKWAREQGSQTIAITNKPDSPLGAHADILLRTAGGAFPYGRSTLSRFSQLAVVNALYAGVALHMDEDALRSIRQKNLAAMELMEQP